jgi:hypothetical protein
VPAKGDLSRFRVSTMLLELIEHSYLVSLLGTFVHIYVLACLRQAVKLKVASDALFCPRP